MNCLVRIIVESQFDARLLKRVLKPEIVQRSMFIYAGGFHALTSVARTHLAMYPELVLVIGDADTTDVEQIEDRRELMRLLLSQAGSADRFRIVLIEPEMEAVFFQDRSALEKWLGMAIDESDYVRAEFVPKKIFEKLLLQNTTLGTKKRGIELVDVISDELVDAIREHPTIAAIESAYESLAIEVHV